MLYYRKDLVPTPPKTWDEMMGDCSIAKKNNIGCYAGQFAKYEGLTVNASEAINTAGGKIVLTTNGKPDRRLAASAEGRHGATWPTPTRRRHPQGSHHLPGGGGPQAFQDGKLLFLRNWPYVYNLATTEGSSKVKDKFGHARHSPARPAPGASTLGGHSAAISVYSKNKATALDFLKFLDHGGDRRSSSSRRASLAPVLGSLYDDPALVAKLPYLPIAEDLDRERRAAPGHPVLPGRHQGHPGKRLRRHQGCKTPTRRSRTCRRPSRPSIQS